MELDPLIPPLYSPPLRLAKVIGGGMYRTNNIEVNRYANTEKRFG